jgi:hypothetical protein
MPEGDKTQQNENAGHVSLDKRADILQATFKHYYDMAMDHHTKAATTSHILLIIVAAIITLVGFDKEVCRGVVDIGSAIGVILIAFLGAMWAWKQHERYHYWEYIACKYQEKLIHMVPMLQPRRTYDRDAETSAAEDFYPFFAKKLKDRFLWPIAFVVIAVIGLGLLVVSILNPCRPDSGRELLEVIEQYLRG